MRARTPKRAAQEREYKKICDEIDAEAKEKGEYKCIFCGREIKGRAFHHHSEGREEGLLMDKDKICLCHFDCHQIYHDVSIKKWPWKEGFLERLREKNLRQYYKEREKENK